jgi:hypothetical protein
MQKHWSTAELTAISLIMSNLKPMTLWPWVRKTGSCSTGNLTGRKKRRNNETKGSKGFGRLSRFHRLSSCSEGALLYCYEGRVLGKALNKRSLLTLKYSPLPEITHWPKPVGVCRVTASFLFCCLGSPGAARVLKTRRAQNLCRSIFSRQRGRVPHRLRVCRPTRRHSRVPMQRVCFPRLPPLLILLACLGAGPVQAACTNPAGNEADIIYNKDYHTFEFCNGTNWKAWGAGGAGGGGGDAAFVTGEALGTIRNDFSGHVGFNVTIGGADITVTQLDRWVVSGNN